VLLALQRSLLLDQVLEGGVCLLTGQLLARAEAVVQGREARGMTVDRKHLSACVSLQAQQQGWHQQEQ